MTHNYQQTPFDSYDAQHSPKQEQRYTLQQVSGEQCNCCARPSDDFSSNLVQMNSYQYSQSIQQRYPYSITNPHPISPFDRKQTTGTTLPRLNASVFTNIATSKHFPQKNINNQPSQNFRAQVLSEFIPIHILAKSHLYVLNQDVVENSLYKAICVDILEFIDWEDQLRELDMMVKLKVSKC
ncbi:7559_t:CDS:2 [Racocetra fulgida]|uniref:7559_t:CDS:1 n=1 Tax=Racocetra fulgida TaxID=60492 RepID=A0A9N8Z8U9_9GLOM|nr:7559_t:CDS:2 [Racocetra fulgida]